MSLIGQPKFEIIWGKKIGSIIAKFSYSQKKTPDGKTRKERVEENC